MFLIGMDTKTVAQSIEMKYKSGDVFRDQDPGGMTFGERFLEKIVQMNFRIPRSDKTQVERLIQRNLKGIDEGEALPQPYGTPKVKLIEQSIQAEQRARNPLAADTELVASKLVSGDSRISETDVKNARDDLEAKAFEDQLNVQEAVKQSAVYLQANPRKIKQFINNFRLYALIAQKRGLFGSNGFTIGTLANAVTIGMRWPDVATNITRDKSFCKTLRDAFRTRESTSSARPGAPSAGKIDLFSSKVDLKRFEAADDLALLLKRMSDPEIESLTHCFHLNPIPHDESYVDEEAVN